MSLEIVIEDEGKFLTVAVEDNPHLTALISLSGEEDNQLVRNEDGYYVPPVEWGDIRNGTTSSAIQVDEAVEQTLVLASQVEVLEGVAEEHTTQIASLEQSKVDNTTYSEFAEDTLLALSTKVEDTDPRLTDSRTPTGPAGGVLSGTYPNPAFAVDMATQEELDQAILTRTTPQQAADAAPVQSVQGRTGDVTISKADVGLGNVDNTSDADKPVSTAQQAALDGKVDKVIGKQLSTEDYTTEEKSKLSGIQAGAQVNVATNIGQGSRTSTTIPLTSSTGTGTTLPSATTSLAGLQSAADKTKLDGIEVGATKNATDAQLRDRATHTGVQPISSISGLQEGLDNKADTSYVNTQLDSKVDVVAGKQLSDQNYTLAEKNKLSTLENYDDTAVLLSLNNKVDKVSGKQLSDENYTLAEKNKLESLENFDDSAILARLDGKVDAVAGMGLSSNDFTDPLRDKLIGLEGTHWRGTFVSLAALQAGVTDPEAGDYADVDAVGDDVVRYIWDATDSVWVVQSGAVAPITASQVKLLYESNPDTNAFTDADEAKLDGIEAGATVNSTDAYLLDRANHTGTQSISTVAGLQDELDAIDGLIGDIGTALDAINGEVI